MALYDQLLLFPERAENLNDRFSAYDVELTHWSGLSEAFRRAFQAVFVRGSSAILLVHGAQGMGKTLFTQRLEQDLKIARRGVETEDEKNLWHTLVVDRASASPTNSIRDATQATRMRRVAPSAGWLASEAAASNENESRVRILVFDDVHRDAFLREWAEMSAAEYAKFKQDPAALYSTISERWVADCRGDFQRTLFLMVTNRPELVSGLHAEVEKSHRGLVTPLELPVPEPSIKERIVRKNTNRLNSMSYWYYLDSSGKTGKQSVRTILSSPEKGFTDSYKAVADAFLEGREDKKRAGRPANKNVLTLVTLGTDVSDVGTFLADAELEGELPHRGEQIGVWYFRDRWASLLSEGHPAETERRAKLVESEFSFQWIALGPAATMAVCEKDGLAKDVLGVITFTPSIAKPDDAKVRVAQCVDLETELGKLDPDEVEQFAKTFQSMAGAERSKLYEGALRRLAPNYSTGLAVFSSVHPDLIVGQYVPCSVTSTASSADADIQRAIERKCHVVEVTAHIRLKQMSEYILKKVEGYASLLEGV